MGEAFMSYHPNPLIREYEDRGMAKWMGFYLSEHTTEMNNDNLSRNTVWEKKIEMSSEDISDILQQSYSFKKTVSLQLITLDENGHFLPDKTGVVEGISSTTNSFYLLDESNTLEMIAFETINNAELVSAKKWSDVS